MARRYTEADIFAFRRRAYTLGLLANASFFNRPTSEMLAICNGVGGEGARSNAILTWIYRHYQLSAAIHDEAYEVGGDEAARRRADLEFQLNLLVEWRQNHCLRWINPYALWARRKITLAYEAVSLFGKKYFNYR